MGHANKNTCRKAGTLVFTPVDEDQYSRGQIFGTRVPHLWVLAVKPIKHFFQELQGKMNPFSEECLVIVSDSI